MINNIYFHLENKVYYFYYDNSSHTQIGFGEERLER